MNRDKETSAVEGVGSREQGNIQTHGESNLCRGSGKTRTSEYCTATGGRTGDTLETDSGESNLCLGKGKKEKTHTVMDPQDEEFCNLRTEEEVTATRQRRTGQWCRRKQFQKKVESFRNSAAKDRLKSTPTHEDLMKIVHKETSLPRKRTSK